MSKKMEKRGNNDRRIEQLGSHENWDIVELRKEQSRRKKEWDTNLRIEDLGKDEKVDKQFLKQLKRKQKKKKIKEERKDGRIKKDIRNP